MDSGNFEYRNLHIFYDKNAECRVGNTKKNQLHRFKKTSLFTGFHNIQRPIKRDRGRGRKRQREFKDRGRNESERQEGTKSRVVE